MGFTTRCLYAPRALGGGIFRFERTNAFSLSCWFKLTPAGNTYAVLMHNRRLQDGMSVYRGWRFIVNAGSGSSSSGLGSLQLELVNSQTGNNRLSVRGNTTVSDGRWYHGVATYDGSSTPAGIKLYVNGALQTMTTVYNTLTGTIIEAGNPFYLGFNEGEVGPPNDPTAAIDEASVYNRVLSASEVTWIYNGKVPRSLLDAGAPTGLQAWWRCGEEGEPFPVVADSAVPAIFPQVPNVGLTGGNATAVNMMLANIVSDVPGRVSEGPDTPGTYIWRSVTFNGTNQYIDCGNLSGFDEIAYAGQIKFQITCWFKTTSYGIIMAKQANTVPCGFCLEICEGADHPPYGITPGVIRVSLVNTPGSIEAVGESQQGNFHDGQWHFLSVYVSHWGSGWSFGSPSIAVDGVNQGSWQNSDNLLAASIANSASLYIGDRQKDQGTNPFEGNLAAVLTLNASTSVGTWYGKTMVNDLPVIYPKRPTASLTVIENWWPLGEGRPCWLAVTGTTHSQDLKSQLAPGGIHGAPGTLIKYGLPPVPATPGPAFMYLKRARDIGSGPPAVYTEWTTTDVNSAPPTSPPIGPWDEIAVVSKWRI